MMHGLKDCSQEEIKAFMKDERGNPLSRGALAKKITKAIENVAKDLKINFVFDKADGTLIYGDKEYDITFKVLDKLK